MNLTHLKYFIEIYDAQSITDAAKNLYVTQPTLSLSLNKLEEVLDTQLLIRSDNKYFLTKNGEIVYKEGKKLLEQSKNIYNLVEKSKNNPEKSAIRLGMTAMYSIQFMNEISAFSTSHNNVQLNLIQEGSYQIQEMLADKKLDIAIVSFPNFHPDKIHIEALDTTIKSKTIYVVIPKTNPLSSAESLTFKDLEGQRFSSLTDSFIIGRLLKIRARDFNFEPNIIAYHNDLQILLHSLIQSDSICLMPIEYRDISDSDDIEWVKLEDQYSNIPIGIATSKEQLLTEDILDFIEIIKQN